ncbi:Cyclin-like protein [Raphanus sativus]|nr:Cyclin-like protein [Raphanus sativus]
MEKTILGNLEWYLSVPTQYVFLARFIKAANPDPEMENMVHFLAELGLMNYDTLKLFIQSVLRVRRLKFCISLSDAQRGHALAINVLLRAFVLSIGDGSKGIVDERASESKHFHRQAIEIFLRK